jgi:hypothetical protein
VVTLLVDANVEGHSALLDRRLRSETWRELRDYLDIRFVRFDEAGLELTTKDDTVWRFCQEKGYYLLTANRNYESDDSLEATIRREGTIESFSVFTFADADRVYQSTDYLDQVVEALLDFLLNEHNYRGSGRLFLP